MRFIFNGDSNDPAINLALEEYCVTSLPTDNDYLIFYINEPSIIIGRHQHTMAEINTAYVKEHQLHVVRRRSGGGAVYHDHGNLNFSFISKAQSGHAGSIDTFTSPVVKGLNQLGIPAERTGRNDITVNGRKISGNAQYKVGDRLVTHGTLLFHTELDHVADALNVKADKLASKGVSSVRSRVANIVEFLERPMTIGEFRNHLLAHIYGSLRELQTYDLNETDWQHIHALAEEKYRNWDWNYGQSPAATWTNGHRFPVGRIDCAFDVQSGQIQNLRFTGDWLGFRDVQELEQIINGITWDADVVHQTLLAQPLEEWFGNITAEELLTIFFE
ncbi:MAG: lipoate--protein ligase [Bacilli bacterium]